MKSVAKCQHEIVYCCINHHKVKSTVPYLLLPILLLCSCKKEHSKNNGPEPRTYKISYNVSGFTQQIIGSAGHKQVNSLQTNSVTGLAASSDFLYYRLYDYTTGNMVHQVNQDSSMANFGSVDDYLPAGKYIAAFVAAKPGVAVNTAALSNGAAIGFLPSQTSWSDTFFQQDTLTVSGSDVNQNISLQRIVGQLTIKLLDIFPAAASKVTIFVSQESNGFSLATATATGTTTLTFNDPVPDALKTTAGYKRSFFMMNNTAQFTVTITCYDANNGILAQSAIPNVSISRNTQTILTGNLFATGASFNVGLNLPFDPNQITVQF